MVDKYGIQDISCEREDFINSRSASIEKQLALGGLASEDYERLSMQRDLLLGEAAVIRSIRNDLYGQHTYRRAS